MAERTFSSETRQALFWALLVAHCAGETTVTRNRIVSALLRAPSIAESHIAHEAPQTPSFDDCVRRIREELARSGYELGSREHLASVRPLPIEENVQSLLRAVAQNGGEGEVTPLELLSELSR